MPRSRIAPRASQIVCVVSLLGAAVWSHAADAVFDRPFIRGMIVSCPRAGQIWGSPAMADSLAELDRLGVDWIGLHPYAGVRRDGTVRLWDLDDHGYLERAHRMVRDGGFELFWKPHLGYWGSFEWRGDVGFDDEASWNRFFTGYRLFLLHQARLAARFDAELLAVGVELEGTTHRPEWRALIAEVRTVYSGRLTYAANWDTIEDVPFWSELDLIGVHAYFPLAEEADPSDEALHRAWDGVLTDLAELSERHGGKPILFAEIGYNRSLEAARRPWAYEMDESPAARRLRQRLIALAIQRVENAPHIEGMFWWKWIPGPNHHDRDFSMKDPEARTVLAEIWGDGSGDTRSSAGSGPVSRTGGRTGGRP